MNTKKVLIISYYWPPAGGPGVQRWLKFAKYLPEFGWNPIIYTPENPSYPLIDESLLEEVPASINLVKTKIWEPYQFAEKLSKNNKKYKGGQFDVGRNQSWKSKLSIFIRGNFFIPDARVFWVKPSIKFLKKYLEEHQIKTIITTGPPHSLHLIGLGLKQQLSNLKWIADFRDPWTEISYYKHLKLTPWADKKHRQLEKKVFQSADITLATSYTDADNFQKMGANALCITNGFDVEKKIVEKNKNQFTLAYIGVLEQLRNPNVLWSVLEELTNELPQFKKDFKLKFVGKIDDKILNQLQQFNLKEHILNLGYLKHQEAFNEMQNADILLITNFPEERFKGIIPGKIFEYLASGNTIISFGAQNSDVQKILEKTNAGQHFTYEDSASVKQFILNLYQRWQNDHIQNVSTNIEEFGRKNLTKQLVKVLDNL